MTKTERRAAMPLCTAKIDEMRSVFGDIEIKHAKENGVEWGEETRGDSVVGPFVRSDGKGEMRVGFLTVAKGD